MNKTPADIRQQLAESFNDKWQRATGTDPLRELLFVDEYRDLLESAVSNHEVNALRAAINELVQRGSSDERKTATENFATQYWRQWTTTVQAEHQQRTLWHGTVEQACDKAVELYQDEYLSHDRYKETFQMAIARLLVLLEPPGIAEPLTRVRNLVTWPARKLRESITAEVRSDPDDDRTEERKLLEELGQHLLVQLTDQCRSLDANNEQWHKVEQALATRQQELLDGYARGLDSYQIMLQGEVDRAAHALYKKLQEQPQTLNKLRAARVSADAVAVVLAVKSGGLGAVDLVLAPAVLSLTTMLTEGALGKYMEHVQKQLRDYQRREISVLINKKFRAPLKAIADSVADNTPLTITEGQLAKAAAELSIDQS